LFSAAIDAQPAAAADSFLGAKAGAEREVSGVKLCWCPPGRFRMGSPPGEPERRPGETQVEVTFSKGSWMAKYETTQGQAKRVMGKLPGPLTDHLPEGDDFPVGVCRFGRHLAARKTRQGCLAKPAACPTFSDTPLELAVFVGWTEFYVWNTVAP